MDSIYDTLLQIPTFQGLARNRFNEILGNTRFHFLKYLPGEQLIFENEPCNDIKFLISGSVRSENLSNFKKVRITETIAAPNVLIGNHLFGSMPYSPVSMYAIEDAGIMQLNKQSFIDLLQKDRIILLNYINMISHKTHSSIGAFRNISSNSIKERLCYFVLTYTQYKSSGIRITCKHRDLYSFFGIQRSIYIDILNDMRASGLLEYDSHGIYFESRDKLQEYLAGLN